jgi:hemin uptake protein HemP
MPVSEPPTNPPNSKPDAKAGPDPPADSLLPKIIKFEDLARCGEEIWIEHQGNLYRLRRTRQDKLILTK